MDRMSWRRRFAWLYALALCAASVWFLVWPVATIVRELADPAWRDARIAPIVVRWHARLTERIAPWARARVRAAAGVPFETHSVSGDEWPLFTCVFYLWATEALQRDWEAGARVGAAPRGRARDAIDAAVELVVDPAHAGWVRAKWGPDYLESDNLFYRFLLIAGVDSY